MTYVTLLLLYFFYKFQGFGQNYRVLVIKGWVHLKERDGKGLVSMQVTSIHPIVTCEAFNDHVC